MKLPIYFDYAATTPVDKRVAEKMFQYLTLDGIFGNPSSRSHVYGWQAEESIDTARNQIASLINADAREIIFTSGATESNNLAIKGIIQANNKYANHIITSIIEHKSVLDTCQQLENDGFKVNYLTPDNSGLISVQQVRELLCDKTILVSIMHVNNEIGVIQNIQEIGKLCHDHNILFHVDAAQSLGKIPINLKILPINLMSFSGHKIYGPKGIGVLYVDRKTQIKVKAQIHGGSHEFGKRAGTLAVHQIVGMGEACQLMQKEMRLEISRLYTLRNKLWYGLKHINGIKINSSLQHGVATLLNVSFKEIDGELIIMALKDLAVSSGSACTSADLEPSYVLRAIGLNNRFARNSIRFSIGRFTTTEEIEFAINQINMVTSSLYNTYK